jgi:hypothetical protein
VLTSTMVDQTVFSVGYAQLPIDSTLAQRQQTQQEMASALAKAMGLPVPDKALAGEPFVLESPAAATPLIMYARVVLHHDVVMRQIVAGPPNELSAEIAQEFIRSLKLR